MDGPPPQRWDRSKWITVFSSHSPTIREVTECLGLGLSPSASTTNRGIPKFDAPDFKKLSSEVTRLSKELPQDRDALLDFAADPKALEKELDELLLTLGPAIWGRDADRTRLVKPDPEKKTYYKDLFYEDPEDRDVLKIHLQRWIVIKACYYIRNRKLKKHSMGEEFDTVADIDAGSPAAHKQELVVKHLAPSPNLRNILSPPQSPHTTPHSGTPPVERSSTPTFVPGNLRKRKSSAFQSLSDDDDASSHGSGLGPRKRSYASLPLQRKSPRKSLTTSRQSSENIPPSPSLTHLQQLASAAPSAAPTPDAGRLLSPLSSSALNGTVRPPSNAASAFAAVNTPNTSTNPSSAFAAVNTSSAPAAPSSNTFAAVNAPIHSSRSGTPITLAPINAPSTAPGATPSAFAAVNASHTSASASPKPLAPAPAASTDTTAAPGAYPSSNSPANAPATVAGGFTAVNVSPSGNDSTAQNSRGYSSPYSAPSHGVPDSRTASHGHADALPHHPAPLQREPSPQKTHPPHTSESQPAHPHAPNVMQTSTPPTLAPNTSSQHGAQYTFQAHNGSTGRERSTFQPNAHVQPAPNGAPFVQAPTLPSNAPTRPTVNGHTAQPQPLTRINPTDMVLLQCDLLGLMMKFFFPRDGPRLEDAILLQNIDYIWTHNEYQFRQIMGHLYDMQTKILYAWMEERRKISQLQYSMESQPGLKASEMVDRLLAMNDLRVMRLKWKSLKTQVGSETLAPEDLLCKTFVTMTKTEGTEKLFKHGLELLNDSVFEFLRSEDMTISISKR